MGSHLLQIVLLLPIFKGNNDREGPDPESCRWGWGGRDERNGNGVKESLVVSNEG